MRQSCYLNVFAWETLVHLMHLPLPNLSPPAGEKAKTSSPLNPVTLFPSGQTRGWVSESASNKIRVNYRSSWSSCRVQFSVPSCWFCSNFPCFIRCCCSYIRAWSQQATIGPGWPRETIHNLYSFACSIYGILCFIYLFTSFDFSLRLVRWYRRGVHSL